MPASLTDFEVEVSAELRPASAIEQWFADEIAYASWELGRVRANRNDTAAESRLNAAYNRASRNWNRARKELQSLQTARVNHVTRLSLEQQETAAATPLADPARTPQPRQAGPMLEHVLDLIQEGVLPTEFNLATVQKEAR